MAKQIESILEELKSFTTKPKQGRLSKDEEKRGSALFREVVSTGGNTLRSALAFAGDLPWIIPTTATNEVWEQLSPARRRAYITALCQLADDSGKRTRLSIARGLFKVDPTAALKIALSALAEMLKDDCLDRKDRLTVFNVLLGKNKPWISQVDLGSLKNSDARLLVLCAIESISFASPPAVIAVLSWAQSAVKLADLPGKNQRELAKVFRPWSPHWRKQLVALELSPLLSEALETPSAPKPEAKEKTIVTAGVNKGVANASLPAERPSPQKISPPDSGKGVHDLLKQIEERFTRLRTEVLTLRQQAKGRAPAAPHNITRSSSEAELVRLQQENERLAQTVSELRQTLNQLASADFDHAISQRADSAEPVTDRVVQFQSLLSLRLRETITEFQNVNRENKLEALPLLFENIFDVLEESGVHVSEIESAAPPVRRRY
jgi:hypothetical protein